MKTKIAIKALAKGNSEHYAVALSRDSRVLYMFSYGVWVEQKTFNYYGHEMNNNNHSREQCIRLLECAGQQVIRGRIFIEVEQ